MQLYIGNKNYSSWSMRAWVLLRQFDIPFEEVLVHFDSFASDSQFKRAIGTISPAGKVPVLVHEGLVIWDTLAIAEYVAELFPEKCLWPKDRSARARARSVCAEMHSGFTNLRATFPTNVCARLPTVGALAMRDKPAVRAEVDRLVAMWSELLDTHGGPMLFGQYSIADSYFSPVALRLVTYEIPVPAPVRAYIERLRQTPALKAWIDAALAKNEFIAFEEPYRLHP